MLLAAALSLGLALRAPLATTAIALMVFGVLHNVLELRYIGGRFSSLLAGPLLRLLLTLVTGIVLVRLVGALISTAWTMRLEILLTYGVLFAAVWTGLRHHRLALAAMSALLALGTITSLLWPVYHVVVITHLHNLVPLVFLWDFAQRFAPRVRITFLAVQLTWVLVVPAVILSGLLDRWITGADAAAGLFTGQAGAVIAGTTPPGLWGTTAGGRFLAVFAFLQLMHFVVWVFFLPRYAPATTAAFEAKVPWLRGWRTWALGLGVGALLLVLFVVDYGQGRTVYSALASYHAFLELPVLLAIVLGFGAVRAQAPGAGPAQRSTVSGQAPSHQVGTRVP
ncbi:hypothetical protein GIS00_10065 [Nakamurella sp. YIM 132087]|uniref:Uncharacterized protein n=1 Tax=Nakamurella alba TaxID=2665158 RepID=A0A7K1FJH9_9ACTN|nr:hypothetical protein [Nakamurella alba]MTD14292.1 hypothetical protein [Nakamurella alba]